MLKKLFLLIITIFFLLSGQAFAANKSEIEKLVKFNNKELLHDYGIININHYPFNYKTFVIEMNKTSHNKFKWKYDRYFLTIFKSQEDKVVFIIILIDEYQEFSSKGRAVTKWTLKDMPLDGVVDVYWRDFKVYNNNVGMSMIYPEGFVNTGWYIPSKKEAQEKFNGVVKIFLKNFK